MENFQLYRTNLLLGGQMKWDLILDSGNAALHVSDFHLTPISPNIPYTYCSDENLLNNTHQDNIKAYYKKLQGYFYNDGLDTQFNHNYPMIVTNGETPTFYSGIYDMGCKRTKHFKLYGKQIEFFCPVWLEKLDGVLSFKVSVYSFGSDIPMGTRTLTFDLGTYDTHNKFVNYFKNFITYTQIDKGNDKLLNISFNQNKAFVSGINVKTGTYVTKDISTIVPNLVSRERPLMEFDNMLIGNFTNNNIICNNLFNFNLCFNLEDLTSTTLAQLLLGKDLTISVDVQIDGVSIDKKTFYTEYDFIERTVFDGYSVINSIDTPNIEEILPETSEKPDIITKKCPNCKTSVPFSETNCPNCGYDFIGNGSLLPDPIIKICPNCGAINDKDAVRCKECRAILNAEQHFRECPVCGTKNEMDAVKCSKCGNYLAVFEEEEEPISLKCPSCGYENPEGTTKCIMCYTPLFQDTIPDIDDPATGKECPFCGTINLDDATTCTNCGHVFKQTFDPEYNFESKTCPSCGALNISTSKICWTCGADLDLSDDSGNDDSDGTVTEGKTCPSCGYLVRVSDTTCPSCGAPIKGNFQPSLPSVTSFSLRRTTAEPDIELNPDADLDDNIQENIQQAFVKEKFNVLEHLKDNKYLEFVNKNKFNQSVCHWSLTGFNDYIFNLYRGFDGLFIDLNTGLTYENEHQYGATPDLNSIKFNPQYNSCGWFNTGEKEIWSEIYLYTIDENLIPKDGTKFDNSIYINNVKYNNTYKGEPFYVYGIVTSSRNVGVFATSVNSKKLNSKNSVYVNEKNNNILIVTDIADEFTFLNLFETLRNTEDLSGNLLKFYDIMRSKISPSLIRFGGLLNWDIADGPTYDIDEIEYYKNDKEQDYVFRYDGSIKPTFISESKYTIYYKDFVSDDRSNGKSNLQNSIYPQYINTGFEPLYPSINYCSIRKCADWKYNALPIVSVTENNEQPLFKYDYSWFNHGKYLHLQYKIKFEHINRPNDYGRYDTLDEIVYEYLKDMYGTDYDTTKYIQSKYAVKNNWEYFSDRNVTDYVYKIELTLK